VNDSTVLLYLDHGDLCRIADGKATAVDNLREAMRDCSARLIVSSAHILDLGKADVGTKDRWTAAVDSLGITRLAIEPGEEREVTSTELRRLLDDVNGDVQAYVAVANVRLEAARASREAHRAAPPALSPSALREIVGSILDGTVGQLPGVNEEAIASATQLREQLRPAFESLGLDRDAILALLLPQFEQLLARGDLGGLVRAHRDRDHHRKPRFSDFADELHMEFAVHADLATVDANVAHTMKGIAGKPFPVDARSNHRREIVVLPSGDLDRVAQAVRAIAAEAE
jgi:hypothetical protein